MDVIALSDSPDNVARCPICQALLLQRQEIAERVGRLKNELYEGGHHIRRQAIEDIINLILQEGKEV